jgi:hypothetical protein
VPQARAPFEGLPANQAVARFDRLQDGSILVETHDRRISLVTDCSGAVATVMDGKMKAFAVVKLESGGGFRVLNPVADRHW